jgi:6-pyruvoyltetrahydropterin/6-carboxytetrahydropterin synthase
MVINFSELKDIVKRLVIDKLDHSYLNDIIKTIPTAENTALWIHSRLVGEFKKRYNQDVVIEFIRLWETSGSYVEL